MKIIELTETQFKNYSKLHSSRNYFQTIEYANIMNNYNRLFLGFINENDNTIMGAVLLLERSVLKFKVGYVPGGFLIDYDNDNLFRDFITSLKNYLKEKKFVYLTTDNKTTYKMFDKKGQIIIDKEECDLDADDLMMTALDAGAEDFAALGAAAACTPPRGCAGPFSGRSVSRFCPPPPPWPAVRRSFAAWEGTPVPVWCDTRRPRSTGYRQTAAAFPECSGRCGSRRSGRRASRPPPATSRPAYPPAPWRYRNRKSRRPAGTSGRTAQIHDTICRSACQNRRSPSHPLKMWAAASG